MAQPGRKPKNVALRVIEGNPGGRPLPEMPDMAKLGAEPPEWMCDGGKEIWMRWASSLIKHGLFSDIHKELLAATCQYWARYIEAEKIVTLKGSMTEDGKKRDATVVSKQAYELALKGMSEMGLTPSEMARMMKASAKSGGKAELYGF